MNVNEIKQAIVEMNPVDFKLLTEVVEERKVFFRKQEIAELIKKVSIGSYASYMRGKVEIVGEIVAMNKKNLFLETADGHKRTLSYEDIFNVYAERPNGAKVENKPKDKTTKK